MHDTEPKALTVPVNKIIPFSVVDGPGSRFAVFFQSCGFSCAYCHNPETMRMCTGCGSRGRKSYRKHSVGSEALLRL